MLHGLRPLLRGGVGLWWGLHLHRQEHAPADGPAVIASNHVGWSDGPLPAVWIDVVVGRPCRTTQTPWPRTREHTLATSALLWWHLRDEQSRALSLTGRALPGPLPAGDIEDDPDTGFVEQHRGAS